MKRSLRILLVAVGVATALASTALLAQSVPEINYDANANILNLPSFG